MLNNLTKNKGKVGYDERCQYLSQKGKVVWLFGMSGAGKSTIANRLEEFLTHKQDKIVYRLDGDNLRFGLNSNLGFSEEDRLENIRRTAEVARLFADAGLITIVSLITPMESMRRLAKGIIGQEHFIEIYIKTSLLTCEKRDPKGLYQKVRNGQIKQFTGIDSPFEESMDSDLVIDTEKLSIDESVEKIWNFIKKEISY